MGEAAERSEGLVETQLSSTACFGSATDASALLASSLDPSFPRGSLTYCHVKPTGSMSDELRSRVSPYVSPLRRQHLQAASAGDGRHLVHRSMRVDDHYQRSVSYSSTPSGQIAQADAKSNAFQNNSHQIAGPMFGPVPRRPLPKPEDLLQLVMERRTPNRMQLAPLDMSCSFSVSDYRQFDMPLVYCSPSFERVSRYSMSEIVGLNHRFLQSPSGRVEAGSLRDHTDNVAVLQMMSKLSLGEEVQVSLMNYKKGGRRWVNLLTMVAVPWDGDDIAYIVGLQVDILERPESVLQKMPNSYYIDYRVSIVPRSPSTPQAQRTLSFVQGAGDSSSMEAILSHAGHMRSRNSLIDGWHEFIIENHPNIMIVCSPKGAISYCSSASERLLGHTSSQVVDLGLQEICHTSDIVPMMRELREAEAGFPVSLLARLRHRNDNTVWVAFQGVLLIEPSRGTRMVFLSGRAVSPSLLSLAQCSGHLKPPGIQFWSRVDPQGMLLWISSAFSSFLGIPQHDLLGKNFVLLSSPADTMSLKDSLAAAFEGRETVKCHTYLPRMAQNYNGLPLQSRFFTYKPIAHVHASIMICTQIMTIGSPTNEVEANDLHTPTNATVRQRASEHNIQQSLTLEDQSDATRSFVYELAPDRNTSWQYELHKVMLTNRRLKRALDNSLNAQTSTTNSPIVTETTCSNCFKRQTTQWRKGPEGPRSLCNSCGLRYAKQLNQRKNDAG